MGWLQFAELLEKGEGDLAQWQAAAVGNPNTPEAALKMAFSHVVLNKTPTERLKALDTVCQAIIDLVRGASENAEHLVAALQFIQEMAAEDIRTGIAEKTSIYSIEAEAREALARLVVNEAGRNVE